MVGLFGPINSSPIVEVLVLFNILYFLGRIEWEFVILCGDSAEFDEGTMGFACCI